MTYELTTQMNQNANQMKIINVQSTMNEKLATDLPTDKEILSFSRKLQGVSCSDRLPSSYIKLLENL